MSAPQCHYCKDTGSIACRSRDGQYAFSGPVPDGAKGYFNADCWYCDYGPPPPKLSAAPDATTRIGDQKLEHVFPLVMYFQTEADREEMARWSRLFWQKNGDVHEESAMTPTERAAKVAEITAAHSLPRRDLWPSVYEDCASLLAIVAEVEKENEILRNDVDYWKMKAPTT